MDIIRKHGLWIVAGVIIIFAIGFYFTVVRKLSAERAAKIDVLETRRDSLKNHASKPDEIPGPKWIPTAAAHAEAVAKQLERCADYLAHQPRNCHTRLFFEDERTGMGKEVVGKIEWTDLLETNILLLQRQLEEAELYGWIPNVAMPWQNQIPTDAQIQEAQEIFWFEKDLADALTGQVERDFAEFLDAAGGAKAGAFQKPADLVINRKLSRLDELIRLYPREKLLAVLEAILINKEQVDLPTIFDRHLRSEGFPWDRVMGITMDDDQRQFLKELVPPGNDLANRQRFVDYVMELRTVRYRSDVIGLLENHDDGINDFKHVATSVKEVSPEGRARLIREMREDWNETRIAQTIATVVSVYDEKDYRLIRDNHNPQVVDISNVNITRPYVPVPQYDMAAVSGPGGRRARSAPSTSADRGAMGQGQTGGMTTAYFKTTGFSMDVMIELEHLPVLMRRLLGNSWYYSIVIDGITPAQEGSAEGVRGSIRESGIPNLRRSSRTDASGAHATAIRSRTTTDGETDAAIALRNYVWVPIIGEGYQFTPLRDTLKTESAQYPESAPGPEPAGPNSGVSTPPEDLGADDRS